MEIRIRETGQVMHESEFRSYLLANNGPSFDRLTPEVMEELGVDPVFEGPQATGGTIYQYSMRQGVEQGTDGNWYTKYVLGPVFVDQVVEGLTVTAAEQEAAWIAQKDDEFKAINAHRAKQMLLESDWADLASVRNTAVSPHLANGADFDAYRLALRAIVINPPVTVESWPVRPDAIWA